MNQQITETTAITTTDGAEAIGQFIKTVTDGLSSAHSIRAYQKAIGDFLEFRAERGAPQVNKALVNAYKRHLVDADLAPSTINQRLSAIRRLVREAADAGAIPETQAQAIAKVKGVKSAGVRAGDWLSAEQAQAMLDAPDTTTTKGTRDLAVLAVLLGAGLRRSECAALDVSHLATRDGRPVIVDLVGKGRRVRTVPIAPWVARALSDWLELAGITDGRVFRQVNRGGNIVGDGITPQAVLGIVREYAPQGIAPHDLRRTFAKLARNGGASLEQISVNLGHASLTTTERYLGIGLELENGKAPSDKLPFGL